jgi:hypothetical protein
MTNLTVVLRNSSGGELDRKGGDSFAAILEEYAREGCLSGGDTLTFIDTTDDEADDDDDSRCPSSPDGRHDFPRNIEEHERCLCTYCGADGDA